MMNRIVVLFLLIIVLACGDNSQDEQDQIGPVIDGDQMLFIGDGGLLKNFTAFIATANFRIIDSSLGEYNGVEYKEYDAEDLSEPKNKLIVHYNTGDLRIVFLSFETYYKDVFDQIKKDFLTARFKVVKEGYGIEELRKGENPLRILMMISGSDTVKYRVFMDEKK